MATSPPTPDDSEKSLHERMMDDLWQEELEREKETLEILRSGPSLTAQDMIDQAARKMLEEQGIPAALYRASPSLASAPTALRMFEQELERSLGRLARGASAAPPATPDSSGATTGHATDAESPGR
jgi:hypothetical protein